MFINIDRDNMTIVHKHRNPDVVHHLSWIECQCDVASIPCGSAVAFAQFDVLQLQRMYEQATGHRILTFANHMQRLLADLSMRLPESDVDVKNLEAQKVQIANGDKRYFKYVKGAAKAEPQHGQWFPPSLKAGRNEELEGQTNFVAEQKPVARAAWEPTAADREQAGANIPVSPVSPTQRAPSAPRQGGTRDTVFTVADAMWEQAGKPVLPSLVLQLRKVIMTELESNHGIKRTTSSNTLGDWQKARIPII